VNAVRECEMKRDSRDIPARHCGVAKAMLLQFLLALLVIPTSSLAGGPRGKPPASRVRRSASSPNRPSPQRSSPTVKPEPGFLVSVLQKHHYACGTRTNGTVSRVLTRSAQHSRGFKVMLDGGTVGRVAEVLDTSRARPGPGGRSSSGPLSEADRLLEIDVHLYTRPGAPSPRPASAAADPRAPRAAARQPSRAATPPPGSRSVSVDALKAENDALRAALLAELAEENAKLRAELAAERRDGGRGA